MGTLDVLTKNAIGDKYTMLDDIGNVIGISEGAISSAETYQEREPSASLRDSLDNFSWHRSGPMLAYAWNYSDHGPGSWAEENFFFLLQANVMQTFGLAVTGITLSRSKSVPLIAWWLPSIFAVAMSFASPVLYCFVSTWWSSFFTVVAGSIQVFLVLQVALYGV
ncbi:hypothetical protein CC80DRAFT_594697 [Byssothecium circinans]|uniref:Uncharacterized protein n=1 Tax=Byssothecium circinans TaxID=147558 RepID=A0A6A5TRQ3_9PLEO|nr:hypothetical protein CC80DRAFT_594697 [Byssothecium circinans]